MQAKVHHTLQDRKQFINQQQVKAEAIHQEAKAFVIAEKNQNYKVVLPMPPTVIMSA